MDRAMQDMSDDGVPVQGLIKLTDKQIKKIDTMISSLCAMTDQSKREARLTLVVRNGKLRFVERPILSEEMF